MNNLTHPESWRSVVGFEGSYEVSDAGRVRSLLTGKMLKANLRGHYLGFSLRRNGASVSRYLHQIVAEAFIGPRPEGLEVRHLNGDDADCRAVNLAYGTHSQNMRDAIRHGTHPTASKTHCVNGHEFTAENTYNTTYRTPDGSRQPRRNCRTCSLRQQSEYKARKAS